MPILTTGAGKFPAIGASYTGPGDINGAALGWWGLRGFSAAYSTGSNPAIDVVDTATGLTTTTINILSDGTLDVATINALGYAVSVTKLYDQSGGGKHFTRATLAQMPTLTTSGVTGLGATRPAMSFLSQHMTASAITQSQSFTESFVGERTSGTAYGYIFGDNAAVLLFNNAANGMAMFAGSSVPSATANDNVFHAAQAFFSNASGAIYIDGSNSAMASMGTTGLSGTLFLYTQNGSGGLVTGKFCEVGVWAGDKTANNSAMNSNQHTYWGF